jgi:DHA1 family tetracycline resistance protein-like MFS transporter
MQSQKAFIANSAPLLLLLFIDGMGLGLVIPILNAVLIDPNTQQFAITSIAMQNFLYGLAMGIFMLGWFFGAAILGDLSDRIGRKKALMICLGGAVVSYFVAAIAVTISSIVLLIVARTVAGLTAGSQAIAQAAVIDLSTEETKARNIGLILCAISFGFIAGPILGAVLSNSDWVSWFSFSTPLYFASLISLLNLILLLTLFHDATTVLKEKTAIKLHYAFEVFASAFKNLKVRHLSVVFFIFILGWSCFYSFVSMFLMKTHHFSTNEVSMFLALLAVGFGIGNGFLVNFFSKRYALNKIFTLTTLLSGLMVLAIVLIPSNLAGWFLAVPLCCCISVAYAVLLTLFSDQVDAESQGWVMGITGSIMALVWAVESVVVGLLATLDHELPMYISAIGLFLTVIAGWLFIKTKSTIEVENSIV